MQKVFIEELIKKAYSLGDNTLIGIGPMSENVIESCMELAKENNFPLMFIASRNQIDLKRYGGGYVNGWDQFDFVNNLSIIANKIGFWDYYVCRDHGGPWQRDEERNAHLPVEEAMKIAKESYKADIEAGFDLLMIDPTKDPFVKGKAVDMDFVIEKTVELIEFCEIYRKKIKKERIAYEVGTEETNGGLTEINSYQDFLLRLGQTLESKRLPKPIFAVGQTGTLVKSTIQAGHFDFNMAKDLSNMAVKYDVYLKEHNADYLAESSLLEHIPARVSAANVAPEFGTTETRGYLKLCKVEEKLYDNGTIIEKARLKDVLLKNTIKTGRWKKWVSTEKNELAYDKILENEKLAEEILDIAGHYVLDNEAVKKEGDKLFNNLKSVNIDGKEFIKKQIKGAIMRYVDCFNLKDLNEKINYR